MTHTSDVLIIGGGIVGCACAYELAKRGARVTLLEYGKTGMQATNAAAGLLAPLGEADAPTAILRTGMQALQAFPALADELRERCGFDIELMREGILKLAFDDDEAHALRRRFAWQRELGMPLQWLDGAMCRELEPRLSHDAIAGVLSQEEAWVSNQLLALAVERAARSYGAVIREQAPVTRVRRSRGRVRQIVARDETFEAPTIVLAAGARSGQIAARMGIDLPVFPVRGQMIALGGMLPPVRHVIWGGDRHGYLVPRANGLIFVGATVEHVGFRRRTTKAAVASLRTMAARTVPQLAAATMPFEWAGLRPGTPDGMPYIGPVAGTNVVAATGHYRNGILLGPITGQWIASGVLDGDWSGVPDDFSPSRLPERGAKRGG
jgi:glycine oxidase